MALERIQVKVYKPVIGDDLLAENLLRDERQSLETELEGLGDDEQRREVITVRLGAIAGELDRRLKARTVTVDVQTATFGGRLRQLEALNQADAWIRECRRRNLVEEPEHPPTEADLLLIPLSVKQREDYIVMASAASIEGAVCRDEEGQPLVTNFDWPATLYGWTEVPNYVFEPVLWQVYSLNPSWSPDWEGSKNG